MRTVIVRGIATVIATAVIVCKGFSQADTDLEDFLQQAPQLVLPEEKVIAVLSAKTADLWGEIYDASYSRQSVEILAKKRGLKVIEVTNVSELIGEDATADKNHTIILIIDESVLQSRLMYEVFVLESVLNLVATSAPTTLGKLARLSPAATENYLIWLEEYAPYRIELARWYNPRYQDIVIYPIGLVFVSFYASQDHNKNLGSVYLTDFHPAGQNEIKSLRQQAPLYEPNLAEEIAQKRLEEIEERYAEIRRFHANSSKISIHWINCDAETARTIANLEIQRQIAKRDNALRKRANFLKNQLRVLLSSMFENRYKISTDQMMDISNLAYAMGISPEQILTLVEQLIKTRSDVLRVDELRVKVEIIPGLVVGILDKVRGTYEYSKINLDAFRVLSIGVLDVRESEVPIMELKFSDLLKR